MSKSRNAIKLRIKQLLDKIFVYLLYYYNKLSIFTMFYKYHSEILKTINNKTPVNLKIKH